MVKIKYIVMRYKGFETGVIFPEHLGHDEFAKNMRVGKNDILGAGFADFKDINGHTIIKCYGSSLSLNIDSRDNDDAMVLTRNYFGVTNMIELLKA